MMERSNKSVISQQKDKGLESWKTQQITFNSRVEALHSRLPYRPEYGGPNGGSVLVRVSQLNVTTNVSRDQRGLGFGQELG